MAAEQVPPGLQLCRPTPPGWTQQALSCPSALLSDHAHCERKAAASAMALVAAHPQWQQGLLPMSALAREELSHFGQVVGLMQARGLSLGRDLGNSYAQSLQRLCASSGQQRLVDRLLIAALIEARSCERLGLLAGAWPEANMRRFYARLARSEAGHARLFVDLADAQGGGDGSSAARLQILAQQEADLLEALPPGPRMH